jgi:hypothetical protein
MMFDPDLKAPLSRRERQQVVGAWEATGPRSWYADPHGFSTTASLGRRHWRRNSLLQRLRAPAAALWGWVETDGTRGRIPVTPVPGLICSDPDPDTGSMAVSGSEESSGALGNPDVHRGIIVPSRAVRPSLT